MVLGGFDVSDRFSRILVSSRSFSESSSEESIVIMVGVGELWVVMVLCDPPGLRWCFDISV